MTTSRPRPVRRKEPEVLVSCDETEASVVCHVAGDLDQASVGEFREAVARLSKTKRVIFELSAVPFVDAAGLGALIGAVRRTATGVVGLLCAPLGRRSAGSSNWWAYPGS
jgi:anti-anti-sigma factor